MTPRQQLIESLRLLCEREGGRTQVAAAIGSSEQTIWQIIAGIKLPSGEPRGVGASLQKRLDKRYPGWHMLSQQESAHGSLFPPSSPRVIENDDEVFVPVTAIKLRVSAGIDGFAIEMANEAGHPIFFRKDWMLAKGYKPEFLHAIKVKGNSMEPTLYAGDLIVINTADRAAADDEVFVLNYAGEVVVKRLMHRGREWWMFSDNENQKRYQPVLCDESCFIIGRVVYRQSEVI